jgi:ABC-type amino acid transport substrate-binding protein
VHWFQCRPKLRDPKKLIWTSLHWFMKGIEDGQHSLSTIIRQAKKGRNQMSLSPRVLRLSSLFLILVFTALIAFSGCKQTKSGNNNLQSYSDTMQRIQKDGVLRVGYVVYPPTVIKDPNTGELSGHFVDAVRFMADVMKVKVQFIEATWSTFVGGLQSGQYDLSVAATYRTIPRAMAVAFSSPIIYIGNGAIIRKGDARFKSLTDFNQDGITIAVAQGEASHEYAREHFTKAKLIVLSTTDLSQPLTEVLAGRADVGLADAWTTSQFAAKRHDVVDLFSGHPYDLTPVGWAVRQNDQEFLNFINTSIDYLMSTGRMEEWEAKYNAHWAHPLVQWEIEK